jgi:hypothetical protein
MRRRYIVFTAILALGSAAGCQRDFDSQYAETEQRMKAAEAEIDAEMARAAKRESAENVNSD